MPHLPSPLPIVIARDCATGRWLRFSPPISCLEARAHSDVLPLLRAAEAATARGYWAVGVIAYEAAPVFDPALEIRAGPLAPVPLAWFGIFHAPREIALPRPSAPVETAWRSTTPPHLYRHAFDHIKRHIREGVVYQVNLTDRLLADSPAANDPLRAWRLFARLATLQRAACGACFITSEWSMLSASPELLFRLDQSRVITRPMKGTLRRAPTPEADQRRGAALRASAKNRAENLMIVDMARNDLGRIARAGSVVAAPLLTPERYPLLWQMTSTVSAETDASALEILAALFPAASITGAPKSSAMRIIAALETTPRGFYTGAAGFFAPNRQAQFNVAIRTLALRAHSGHAEYGTGGGIVWDSIRAREQDECRIKAEILQTSADPFSLLETMRFDPKIGVLLLDQHLARLAASAHYFGIAANINRLRARITAHAATLPPQPHRLRLLLGQKGRARIQTTPLDALPPEPHPIRLAFAPKPVDPHNPFLYHKTTRRAVYDAARAACPDADDAILMNLAGEITETTRASLAAEIDGQLCTPPVRCGLLPGVLRHHLIEQGVLIERPLLPEALAKARRIVLISALRGERPACLIAPSPTRS